MTARILKSATATVPDFEVAVAAHASAMRHWREHMARVKLDEASGVTGINKHAPYGRPGAHPLVDAAVDENGVAAFEIVDDGPTPEQLLSGRKADLLRAVTIAEQAAIAAVIPLGKRRLFNMRESAIRQAHVERVSNDQGGVVKTIAAAIGISSPVEMPADDARFIDEQNERRARIAAIELVAAQAHHDIEDLTLSSIDTWTAPKFPD